MRRWETESRAMQGLPGLLPWQVAFLAAICGLLALRWPLPGAAALATVALLSRCLDAAGPRLWVLPLAFFAGLGWGALRLPPEPPSLPAWATSGAKVRIHAVVDELLDRPGDRIQVLLNEIRIAPLKKASARAGKSAQHDGPAVPVSLPGRMLWSYYEPSVRPVPGSRVVLDARVAPMSSYGNPGAWDYVFSWRIRGGTVWRTYSLGPRGLTVDEVPGTRLWRWREGLKTHVMALLSTEQSGALVRAMLFGDRSGLAPEVSDSLIAAGLAHTLALSGLHLGFVVLLGAGAARLLGWVWPGIYLYMARPRLAVLVAAPLVLGYCWLGSFSPSLVRSACMFVAWGWLLWRGRSRVLLDGLFFALVAILLVSPLSVFDLRLQLSALAVAGIVVLVPLVASMGHALKVRLAKLERRVVLAVSWGLTPLWALAGILAVSLSAQLAVLPLTAWSFGRLAPNFLLNIVWLPVLGFVVLPLGLGGLVLAPLWPGAAELLLQASTWAQQQLLDFLAYGRAAEFFPLVTVPRPQWPSMLGWGLLLVLAAASFGRGRRVLRRLVLPGILGMVLLLVPFGWTAWRDAHCGVRLDVVDVGAGQALCLTLPGGRRLLVDGGGVRSPTFDVGRAILVPWLTWGRLPGAETLILTHPHLDHYQGLSTVLETMRVRGFLFNGRWPSGSARERLEQALARQGLTAVQLVAGDRLELDQDLWLEVLHPPLRWAFKDTNEASLALRLVWRDRGLALLCGDLEAKGVAALLDAGRDLRAEVLVLPHHGGASGASEAFYRAVSPRLAVASCRPRPGGVAPSRRVTELLDRLNIPWLDTDRKGLIDLNWPDPMTPVRVQVFRDGARNQAWQLRG